MSDGTVEREGYGKALFDPGQFRDKVVMVTGAGKGSGPGGIGYNAAMAFARAGARLAIIGRTAETIGRTIADAEALGAEVVSVVGDVSDEAAIEKLFAATEKSFGRLDILINNAGVSGDVRAIVRIPGKSWRYAFNVHLHTLTTTRLAARLMRATRIEGTILNIGTYFTSPHRQILRPYPFRTPYTGAQAWKLEHSRVSAWDLAKDGIRVIALNLGPVEGGRIDAIVYPLGAMERGLWGRDVAGADIRRKTEEMHPARRFLKQDDAARSILALVSSELRDSANGTVVELAGGVDYKVPPQVAPPLSTGRPPDLSGRRVLLTGRPAAAQAEAMILAFAACGAQVSFAAPQAPQILLGLAGGKEASAYGDGQKRLLGQVRAFEMSPDDEPAIAALFERLADEGDLDAVVVMTGETATTGETAEMEAREAALLKERFAFEPADLMRHALATLLLQGQRRAGVKDPRFLTLSSFMAILERQRGVPGSEGAIQRIAGGFTIEEEAALQSGARQARGSLIVVGPSLMREEADEWSMIGVLRAGLQAVVSSVATETATARSLIRVNALYPGSDASSADPNRAARAALQLAADASASVSGMVYYPDERNAILGTDAPLSGRTAVVTGGGRNLGQAIALRLAREGARVVVAGRGQVDLDLTVRAARALGGDGQAVLADIAFPGEREKILDAACAGRGRTAAAKGVDLWVNNAGIGGAFATLDEIELEGEGRWHQTLAVNFTGAWLGMVRAILDMRRRAAPGGIVNVSTFYADQPYVFRIPYTVPKILLKTCAELLADPLRPHQIFISDIQPSLIDGPRFQWVAKNYAEHFRRHGLADPMADPAVRDWFNRLIPARAPSPAQVADAVFFAHQRGLAGSGQGMAVSTLPVGRPQPARNGSASSWKPGTTVVIISGARSTTEIDRTGLLASWCLESGSQRVIVAADDVTLSRLRRRLQRGASDSSWWNLPIAPAGDGRLEIHAVDPASSAAVADLFETLGQVDSVLYAPGAPEAGERFVLFPSEVPVGELDAVTLEDRYLEHQRALSLFLERQVTAGLIVARQAVRSLAPGGTLSISRAPALGPEAILAAEALGQIVRTAAEEFRLLGRDRRIVDTDTMPVLG
ncbi:MAG TPA: SDR family NAD(P)-dependent oxidoreductase, partial [Candidatus Polarisedimenticolia bacterium]